MPLDGGVCINTEYWFLCVAIFKPFNGAPCNVIDDDFDDDGDLEQEAFMLLTRVLLVEETLALVTIGVLKDNADILSRYNSR